jgi:hypothetical protein
MVTPPLLGDVFLLIWLLGGAALGASLGWYSADLLHLDRRPAWLDAAMGVSGILILFLLVAAVTQGGIEVVDDRTLGWRGLLLDHLIVWGLGTIVVTVVGRQLLVTRRRRARRPNARDGVSSVG